MNSSCAKQQVCNCDPKDKNWREDSDLLTDKTHLPAKELRRKAEGATTHWESSSAMELPDIITQVINAQNTLLFCLNQSKKEDFANFM